MQLVRAKNLAGMTRGSDSLYLLQMVYWHHSWLARRLKSTALRCRSLERSMSWGADFVQAIVRSAPPSASGMAWYMHIDI